MGTTLISKRAAIYFIHLVNTCFNTKYKQSLELQPVFCSSKYWVCLSFIFNLLIKLQMTKNAHQYTIVQQVSVYNIKKGQANIIAL